MHILGPPAAPCLTVTAPQAGRSTSPTLAGTVAGVMRNEGPSGLYKGLPAQLLKTVLVAALMQMARRHGGTHLHRPRLTWHAVVSGLSASCATGEGKELWGSLRGCGSHSQPQSQRRASKEKGTLKRIVVLEHNSLSSKRFIACFIDIANGRFNGIRRGEARRGLACQGQAVYCAFII